MKKLIALLLAAMMILALAACGSSGKTNDTPKTDTKTDAPAEVKWPTGDVTIAQPAAM